MVHSKRVLLQLDNYPRKLYKPEKHFLPRLLKERKCSNNLNAQNNKSLRKHKVKISELLEWEYDLSTKHVREQAPFEWFRALGRKQWHVDQKITS
jgi:hypothetical protein